MFAFPYRGGDDEALGREVASFAALYQGPRLLSVLGPRKIWLVSQKGCPIGSLPAPWAKT